MLFFAQLIKIFIKAVFKMRRLRSTAKALSLERATADAGAIVCALVFACAVCLASTIASYSGGYTVDLEQKQSLLDSIKEDAHKTAADMKENSEKPKPAVEGRTGRLRLDGASFAGIMPSADKIDIAFSGMGYTLSPESGIKPLKESSSRRTVRQ
jgi:hypothetical protein